MTSPTPAADPATSARPKAKNISNPRRLLILTPTSHSLSIIPPLLHSLTGVPVLNPPQQTSAPPQTTDSTPPPPTTTFAGYTTHTPLRLETKYYTTEVPVWVDEIPLAIQKDANDAPAPTAEQWKSEFLSADAEIVRDAVGALVVCAHNPSQTPPTSSEDNNPAERADVRALRDLLRGVGAVKERIDEERGGVGDVPGVFVLVGGRKGLVAAPRKGQDPDTELGLGNDIDDLGASGETPFSVGWWEDQFFDMGLLGWEVVEWDPKEVKEVVTRNQYGEREGMPRIKEILETHDWSMTGSSSGLDGDDDPELDSEDDLQDQLLGMGSSRGFGDEVSELEREMFGLRMAIERGGDRSEEDEPDHSDGEDEIDVESMEALMMRMQAIKDMSSELPERERKRFAAKAVQDIMREL